MTELEWDRIKSRLGYVPRVKPGQLTCPMLHRASGDCRVYPVRPMLCRLWGLVKKMACPWGCVPERWLTDEEAVVYLAEAGGVSDTVYRQVRNG